MLWSVDKKIPQAWPQGQPQPQPRHPLACSSKTAELFIVPTPARPGVAGPAFDDVELDAHGWQGREDVGEKHDTVGLECAPRLQGQLNGNVRGLGAHAERVLVRIPGHRGGGGGSHIAGLLGWPEGAEDSVRRLHLAHDVSHGP